MKNMHGHTKIELTNVNTGEVKTVEDNNMVTNAMEHLFNAPFDLPNKFEGPITMWRGGGLNHTSPQDNILRYTRGLMLFEDPIPEDPDIITPPGGNKVIGVADTRTYSGPILEYGSYNNTESFIDMTAKKAQYVWDFSTSQANGKISAVSLIPQDHAQMAYGVATRDTSMAKYNVLNWIGSRFESNVSWNTFYNYHLPKRRHNADVNSDAWQRYVYPYFNLEKNFGLTNDLNYFITCNHYSYNRIERYSSGWDASSKNRLDKSFFGTAEYITLGKFKLNSERFKFTDTCQDNDIQQDMEEIIVTMPEELSTILKDSYSNIINTATASGDYTALIGDFQVTEKYIYIACVPFYSQNYSSSSLVTGTIQPGQKFYIWRIDIFNNFISDYFEVENTLEEDIYFVLSSAGDFVNTSSRAHESFYIFDNNIICNVNGYLYNYNISQQTWTPIMMKNTENKCSASSNFIWNSNTSDSVLKDTQNGLLIKGYCAYYQRDSTYTPDVSIIDINNNLCFYSNSGGLSSLGVISSGNQNENSYYSQFLHCFTPVYGHKLFKYAFLYSASVHDAYPNILQGFAYRNPLLMTINNIDPVEKTNEYIMKVTYTLTWD